MIFTTKGNWGINLFVILMLISIISVMSTNHHKYNTSAPKTTAPKKKSKSIETKPPKEITTVPPIYQPTTFSPENISTSPPMQISRRAISKKVDSLKKTTFNKLYQKATQAIQGPQTIHSPQVPNIKQAKIFKKTATDLLKINNTFAKPTQKIILLKANAISALNDAYKRGVDTLYEMSEEEQKACALLFNAYDINKNGLLDRKELWNIFSILDMDMPKNKYIDLDVVIVSMDMNNDTSIELSEFVSEMLSRLYAEAGEKANIVWEEDESSWDNNNSGWDKSDNNKVTINELDGDDDEDINELEDSDEDVNELEDSDEDVNELEDDDVDNEGVKNNRFDMRKVRNTLYKTGASRAMLNKISKLDKTKKIVKATSVLSEQVETEFNKLDLNNDSKLSSSELKQIMKQKMLMNMKLTDQQLKMAPFELDKYLDTIIQIIIEVGDTDKDGSISLKEADILKSFRQ